MIDVKLLRFDIERTCELLQRRGVCFARDEFQKLEEIRKQQQMESERLQNLCKLKSQQIGKLKAAGNDVDALLAQVNQLAAQRESAQSKFNEAQSKLQQLLDALPNLPSDDVPIGKNEEDNCEIRRCGEIKSFNFNVKEHADLQNIGLNFASASKIAAARFVVLEQQLAKLHRALAQFMLDTHTLQHGYREMYVPYIVNAQTLYGTGQLPKFSEDLFKTNIGDRDFYLIPTAEVSLTNLYANEIVAAADLPLKIVAQTPCFRSEAGAHGKDVRGMIRQHQFEKVELVQLVRPEDSANALEELTSHAEAILQKLQLPYRVMLLCSGDMGFAAQKTYDLEVWLPGQKKYREISSCSNCGDFQTRRMQARYRGKNDKKPQLLHSLNGSGLAVGRTLVAILENYQQADGSIAIPEVLIPYMNGLQQIAAVTS